MMRQFLLVYLDFNGYQQSNIKPKRKSELTMTRMQFQNGKWD
jgi:hypothetical protein